jgi:SAM-dependent methyltransferase
MFDAVADEYDAARPAYPPELFEHLGPLEGIRALDVGAGTGIATRQLLERGAEVVAVDAGVEVLRRATARTDGLAAAVGDGARLPVRDRSIDLVCFAQAWHWLDPTTRVAESHRVLRPGGRWAAWWSQARPDDEAWFDAYWTELEVTCPGVDRIQRDVDWGATVAAPELLVAGASISIPWVRTTSVDTWLTDQASHSYVAALEPAARDALLGRLRTILTEQLPSEPMVVPYETQLWIATRS